MSSPADRKYSQTHEWHKQEGDVVTIGVSQFAVDELTDVTFVDLPQIGKKITAGKPWGEIESVKATSELYSAISGEVIAVNDAVKDDPSLVNQNPYDNWLIKVKAPGADLSALLDAAAYDAQH